LRKRSISTRRRSLVWLHFWQYGSIFFHRARTVTLVVSCLHGWVSDHLFLEKDESASLVSIFVSFVDFSSLKWINNKINLEIDTIRCYPWVRFRPSWHHLWLGEKMKMMKIRKDEHRIIWSILSLLYKCKAESNSSLQLFG
jgi:hypothetical protein